MGGKCFNGNKLLEYVLMTMTKRALHLFGTKQSTNNT